MSTKEIFIDNDCISAFLWVGEESILPKLYPNKIVIPKPVYDEIDRPYLAWMKMRIDNMVKRGLVRIEEIIYGTEEFELYYLMTEKPENGHKIIGNGEASSIALAKARRGIVASNNFRDILEYIKEYNLELTTTGKIMVEAYSKGMITESEGNQIWQKMLKKRRKLGACSFTEYMSKFGE